ncbi:hypothetical protein HXX76_014440 [Chlamydomonas incerta]|uniref:Uncharacterized protein n=1 Tax=Chlamydomonas incerta TaxID=51695 RepID=A0A835SPS2_CHLIN|nr:hypothetical protein HXX76_014440 [Chlamydomonas incerta]|eukprot:KAG2424560.1 hypothetical protein HXX76_014440 [Chlamydomonas incerta]
MAQAATLPSLIGKPRKPAATMIADGSASRTSEPGCGALSNLTITTLPVIQRTSASGGVPPAPEAAFSDVVSAAAFRPPACPPTLALHDSCGALGAPPSSSAPARDSCYSGVPNGSGNAPLWRRFVSMRSSRTTTSAPNDTGPQPQSWSGASPAVRPLAAAAAGGAAGGGGGSGSGSAAGVERCRRLAELRAVVAAEMGPDFPAAHWPPNAAQAAALLDCGVSAASLRARLRQLQPAMGAPVLRYLVYAAPGLLANDEVEELLEAVAALTDVAPSTHCGGGGGMSSTRGGSSNGGGLSAARGGSDNASSSSSSSVEVAAVDVFRAAPALMGLDAATLWGRALALLEELAADGRDEVYFRAMLRAQPHLLAAPAQELRLTMQLLREVASAPVHQPVAPAALAAGVATAAGNYGGSASGASGAPAAQGPPAAAAPAVACGGGGGSGGGSGSGWFPAWGSELALATPAKLGALLHTTKQRLLRLRYVRQQLEELSAATASGSSGSGGLEACWQQQQLQLQRRWRPAEPMTIVVRHRMADWAQRHPGYADWEARCVERERQRAAAITEWTLAFP